MKKLLILSTLFCFSFALQAQSTTEEDFDKMQDQMRESMEGMMKMFEGAIDLSELSMMKMDTMIFKSFGEMGENGEVVPNEELQSLFQEMEKMMKEGFGDMNFEMMPLEDTPAIPAPESLEETEEAKPKKERPSEKKKKKRKSYSL